jgi:hypothetical protein
VHSYYSSLASEYLLGIWDLAHEKPADQEAEGGAESKDQNKFQKRISYEPSLHEKANGHDNGRVKDEDQVGVPRHALKEW